ncbi:MAG TPA: HPr(Ser) kinase/phosphatase [Burkholderiaceae bacterium]|nr:HPr(Ser) kinase/phosphatase [Burkholderiaceae bacterium]
MTLTVKELVDANRESLSLHWLAGAAGGQRTLAAGTAEPADLVGHLNLIHPARIHVLGHEEIAFYARLLEDRRLALIHDVLEGHPPAIIIAEGLEPPSSLAQMCEEDGLPLLSSPLQAGRVIDHLRDWLSRTVAESCEMHGVLMDVLGMGVLISGESGLGKSELCLELISRGHGLVADDVVEFVRIAPNAVEGRCPPLLQNLLEVRGLGLLDIKTIFGETAVRRKMKLRLIVHLIRRSTMENEYQRLPLEALTQDVLGVPISKVVIPVAAGRNLAVLTEAAVRSTILQLRGIDTTSDFIERQHQIIQSQS